jgi:acetyltransferase-like isoleucine patch superfamily enzyme
VALNIIDRGLRNIVKAPDDIGTGTIIFEGNDNIVELGEGVRMDGGMVRFGTACHLQIAPGCRVQHIDVFGNDNARITIGRDSNFTWFSRLYAHEPGQVTIGSGCLIASDTFFSNSDVHSIFDIETGERLNPPADVTVGDHVWIAEGARIHKGARIGAGSVIGARSIVTGDIPENCILAGTPAKVLRKGVRWEF